MIYLVRSGNSEVVKSLVKQQKPSVDLNIMTVNSFELSELLIVMQRIVV